MTLRPDPDFLGGARALVRALASHPSPEARTAILSRVAKQLGEEWYPAFIKMLSVVGESDDHYAQQLLADALASAMRKGELPSGSLTSWGVSGNWIAPPAGIPNSFFRSAPRRLLGPIEYLTSWHSQSTNRVPLSDDVYRTTLSSLIRLFNASPAAAQAYQAKLAADTVIEREGTFTVLTRARLVAIAELWSRECAPEEIAWRAVQTGSGITPGEAAASPPSPARSWG
jgi:hypothetical protein